MIPSYDYLSLISTIIKLERDTSRILPDSILYL